jgi:hypothetical protein
MRMGFIGAASALLTSATLAWAQAPSISDYKLPTPPLIPVATGMDMKPGALPSVATEGTTSCCDSNACGTTSCCTPCCEPPCGPPGRVWASGEFLLWWIKNGSTPPLVTASPASSGGILGMPGTEVIFGGALEHEEFLGGRFTLGFWLDSCQTIGAETEFFFLGSRSTNFTNGGAGTPGSSFIARPFFDILRGTENAEAVNAPGVVAGSVNVNSRSNLWGIEENGIFNLCCCCCYRVDFLAGFRYLQLDETIDIRENLNVLPTVPGIGGTNIMLADDFNTRNEFYGGQIGARAEYRSGNLFANVVGKIAFGETHEIIDIHGATVFTPPGGPSVARVGGLLALPTNSGRFTHDEFAVVPEVGVNVGYQVTDHVRAYVGYTFLYWSEVARPGDQIDTTINASQLPTSTGAPSTLVGPARPAFVLHQTDFWAQGINFGLEFRY